MATSFRHSVTTNIGTTPVDVLQIQEGVRVTVIGCNVANITDADTVLVDIFIVDEFSTVATYIKEVPIPPNTSVKFITNGEKLVLPASSGIRIVSDTDNSIDSVISYVEIS
jgi:hypothetical protein